MIKKLVAIILAGGIEQGELAEILDERNLKPLLIINGKPMITRIIECIEQVDIIKKIYIVGRPEIQGFVKFTKPSQFLVNEKSLLDGLKLVYSNLAEDEEPIILSDDIPLITPEVIKKFIKIINSLNADCCYVLIPKTAMEKEFPNSTRTFFSLKEGKFCGADIGYLTQSGFKEAGWIIDQLYSRRKKTGTLVKLLGLKLTFKFIFKIINLPEIEKRIQEIVKISVKFLIMDEPIIGMDIDKIIHYKKVLEYLERRKGNG
ncbi:nucleotidyltransferase family protein [Candidatus Dependentiae bacterium]|nr:nucleotidyltransferase family protein [Candidatus Dependentiae bacterium]